MGVDCVDGVQLHQTTQLLGRERVRGLGVDHPQPRVDARLHARVSEAGPGHDEKDLAVVGQGRGQPQREHLAPADLQVRQRHQNPGPGRGRGSRNRARRGLQPREQRGHEPRVLRKAKLAANPVSGPGPQPIPQRWVGEQLQRSLGHGAGRSVRDAQTSAVAKDLGRAASFLEGHDRRPGLHRLQDNRGKGVLPGWQQKDIRRGVECEGIVLAADEKDAFLETGQRHVMPQPSRQPVVCAANPDEARARRLGAPQCLDGGLHEQVEALAQVAVAATHDQGRALAQAESLPDAPSHFRLAVEVRIGDLGRLGPNDASGGVAGDMGQKPLLHDLGGQDEPIGGLGLGLGCLKPTKVFQGGAELVDQGHDLQALGLEPPGQRPRDHGVAQGCGRVLGSQPLHDRLDSRL